MVCKILFYMLFIFHDAYGEFLRLPQCGKFDISFTKFYHGNKFDESVPTLISQADFKTCTLKCALYPKCKSISYKDDGTMCLIHQESLDDEGTELVNAVGWTHARSEGYLYNLGPICKSNRPCKHGHCIDNCSRKGYHCFCENKWILQVKGLCFHADNAVTAKFSLTTGGLLQGIRMVHKSGGVTCCRSPSSCNRKTNFGCDGIRYYVKQKVSIIIKKDNEIILPIQNGNNYFYEIPGYNADSPELILDGYNQSVTKGEILEVLYDLDYPNDNSGSSCVDIYASFCDE